MYKYVKLSIICVVYNARDCVLKTINNVLEQDFKDKELIVIDGASDDGTLDILKSIKEKIDVLISEKDKGIYDAMNKGIHIARGEWITFLNINDTYTHHKVLSEIFEKGDVKDKKLIYGQFYVNSEVKNKLVKPGNVSLKKLKYKCDICHQAVFVKKSITPLYDLSYKLKADYNWLVDIMESIEDKEVLQINLPIVNYTFGGVSRRKGIENLREYIRLTYNRFGFVQVLLCLPYYFRALRRCVINEFYLRSLIYHLSSITKK